MKRISLIILVCLFGIFISGYSQQRMTRYIHQKDYIDYGNEMFTKTTIDIYQLAMTGKIKAYADSGLSITYDQEQLNKRTEQCETVKRQDNKKDTTVCLPLDYNAVTFWLKIKRANEQMYTYPWLPVAIFCDSAQKQKLLFYLDFQDLARLDSLDQYFLLEYLDNANHHSGWALINQENIKLHVKERFATVTGIIKSITPTFNGLYDSDSLETKLTPETYQKKKEILAGMSQKLDSDETIEIFLGEELSSEDGVFKIKENSVGIGGDVQIGKSSLSDMPFFYMSYGTTWCMFSFFSHEVFASFGFLINVSKYQIYKSITDMSWH